MKKKSTALALFLFTAYAGVALGEPATKAQLDAKIAKARFDARSWKLDLEAVMEEGLLSNREDFARAQGLAGLDPQVYLRNRRPEPSVAAELKLMKLPASVLFATYLKTFQVYPFADRSAYPVSLTDRAFDALRAKERDALRQGLIVAIGASGHPASQHLLAEIMLDRRLDEPTRSLAAVHLGETAGDRAEANLLKLYSDPAATELLKASALSGLGQLRTPSSLEALSGALKITKSVGLKKAAVAALGNLGSAWAQQAEPRHEATALRARAAAILVDTLLSGSGSDLEIQTLEALTRAVDADALARLRAAEANAPDDATRARAGRAAARMTRALERL